MPPGSAIFSPGRTAWRVMLLSASSIMFELTAA